MGGGGEEVGGGGGVNHSLPAAYVAFNDVIIFSDVNLNDNVRDVHYNQYISNTRKFSIFILPWVG